MTVLLECSALTVRRGRRTVLAGVDLDLRAGEAVHLAGPNGSGKTSLLRVLAGLAAPRGGRVRRHGVCAFLPERIALARRCAAASGCARCAGCAACSRPTGARP